MAQFNLFLDDLRTPNDVYNYMHLPMYIDDDWLCVHNTKEFIDAVNTHGIPDRISFDHDLGLLYDDGAKTARAFIDYCMANDLSLTSDIYIHTQNPVGRERIESLFKSYFKVLSLIKAFE